MTEASAMSPARPARPFYWSVRREVWEHSSIWIAPLVGAAFGLTGFLLSTFHLPRAVHAAVTDPKKADALMTPYSFTALAVLLTAFVVSIFYALAALNGERRDRSILFWKSLPVSDTTAVLAKAAVPFVVMPAVSWAIIFAAQVVMLVVSTVVVVLSGQDAGALLSHVDLRLMWAALAYVFLVNTVWLAPVYGWLLMISAWSKRLGFVWALAPPLGLALIERIVFNSTHVIGLLSESLFGGFAEAASVDGKAKAPIEHFSQIDPLRTFSSPHIWIGLLVAALFLFAAIRLRRRNAPF